MKKIIALFTVLVTILFSINCTESKNKSSKNNSKDSLINISNIKIKTIDGGEGKLSDYNGKVLLIVNVASQCGYTPQYEGLQRLYDKYRKSGFEILAFPCNDFGQQEPGTTEEIKQFCKSNYNVTFPLFEKIKVLGNEKNSLYDKLINFEPQGDISWNFEKFVIDKNGNVIGRFKSKIKPEDEIIISLIEKEMAK